jgi:beta-N-acetylhexosaminidase
MAGAKLIGGREVTHAEAAVCALQAGCDMVLLCNQSVSDQGVIIDVFLDDLAQALRQGRWNASEDSDMRRLALLPASPPMTWDTLMRHGDYMHALELIP